MERKYADVYRDLYERHWWWRAREAILLREISAIDWPDRTLGILDVGCGDGLFLARLAELGSVSGIEVDANLVSPTGPFKSVIHLGPFDKSYCPGKRFDLILMLDVLEHLDDPIAALTRARELLCEHGVLLVTVPALRQLWSSHDTLNQHRRRYTRSELRAQAVAAGLVVTRTRYFFHWTVPAMFARHVIEQIRPRLPRNPRIPPHPLNRFLEVLTKAEYVLTKSMRLPVGSSIFAVIRRPAS